MSDNRKINALETCYSRVIVIAICFCICFLVISYKLFDIMVLGHNGKVANQYFDQAINNSVVNRKNIIDRNGYIIATNLTSYFLYANPKMINDPKYVAGKLSHIIKDLDYNKIVNALQDKSKNFVWIKRDLTPKQQYEINKLGIKGLFFESKEKRVYPQNKLISHILGYVDVDGNGIAGVEKYFNQFLVNNDCVNQNCNDELQLSIDIRVQHIVRQELEQAIKEFKAIGGVAIIMDANNGEIISMVSLPDFDPNHPSLYDEKSKFNNATLSLMEVGSIFKNFTIAMAIDSGTVGINDLYEVKKPIYSAGFKINDFYSKGMQYMNVAEIFIYSSNIGIAQIVSDMGVEVQKYFLNAFGLMKKLSVEIPEKSTPLIPKTWSNLHAMTIGYGHGIALTPLHVVSATTALINGGLLHSPTLIKGKQEHPAIRVIKETTSDIMLN